ncbi:MAG: RAMP superfamily protein [Pseudanabaenaceae cyanobacterium SKYGB_i_bin29]|nr:RAMP superfamily protein [Pseudanabaenaceae cyanobacterium SKYG29]MDW8420433.1 RAMP superfamily protein [Pseudanabaenaceae cyanobacterium SKYGB_i_bin29]
MPVPDPLNKIPMAYRAQVQGRCQIQRLDPHRQGKQDAELWAEELIREIHPQPPAFPNLQTRTYQITWRFVTNSGQDEGVIRPVLGARGYPFYPGSSMKGAFRRACTREQAVRYCGSPANSRELHPGILRFHGGYPTSNNWRNKLVDIVHPQQQRQVISRNQSQGSSAFVQISLYQPELRFAISSTEPLSDEEWETIWKIWEKAFAKGIGCRVSAGYGHAKAVAGERLYVVHSLKGQGMASKLLSGEGEFRPNMFRAALRGHAMRIFGGLTDERTATREVERLFGGVSGHGTVGLLLMNFTTHRLEMGRFGSGNWEVPTYKVEGDLEWLLAKSVDDPRKRNVLQQLIEQLNIFAVTFGGFGKSWRRADHRLFYKEYYQANNRPLIGCHWQWLENPLKSKLARSGLATITNFLDTLQNTAREWLSMYNVQFSNSCNWREAWRRGNVRVWGRLAENREDSLAIDWLHREYARGKSIKRTFLTGRMGTIGRLWHRMFPVIDMVDGKRQTLKLNGQSVEYIELLTIFPDNSPECRDFLQFLTDRREFQKLWG